MQMLYESMAMPPPISKYAAAHIVAANTSLIDPSELIYRFTRQDVLDLSSEEVTKLVGETDLVTIFFTLNELYSTSMAKTNALLLCIKESMAPGSHILVVDSAGSYATVTLNGSEKNYPMQWLLDHTMINEKEISRKSGKDASVELSNTTSWTKLRSEESIWFRIPEGLRYPLELENMRYQLHLYKKAIQVPEP
jgi:25S rRNA (uracil2843-N3)-methyltransferase